MNRKTISLLSFIVYFSSAVVVQCSGQVKTTLPEFKIEQIASNVYVFIPPRPLADVVHGNCTLVIGTDACLVVDTFGDHLLALKAIAETKKITNKPVKYVLTTHWHYDHLGGNKSFKDAYPQATFICHENALKDLKRLVVPNFKAEPNASKELIAEYEQAVKSGMKNDSTPLTSYERNTRYPETARDLTQFVQGFSKSKFSFQPPDLTFSDSLQLNLGTDTVQVVHLGWGHSPDDAMVYIPRHKILVTGDVVVSPVPYAFNTIRNDWVKILKQVIALPGVNIIVPGHGEIQYNKTYLSDVAELLEEATRQIKDCFDRGLSPQQTQAAITLRVQQEKFAGQDPVRLWAFQNYFLKPRISNYYRQFKK